MPRMELRASPIWFRSIFVEVENPGVMLPGKTDIPPPYGVARPPRAYNQRT